MGRASRRFLTILVLLQALSPSTAAAYVGPGAGFTVIGTGLLTLAIALLVIVGLAWYPIDLLRRTIARRAGRSRAAQFDD